MVTEDNDVCGTSDKPKCSGYFGTVPEDAADRIITSAIKKLPK